MHVFMCMYIYVYVVKQISRLDVSLINIVVIFSQSRLLVT